MSIVYEALEALLIEEGGYVNDPVDRGGETYRGISRVHNPRWAGWREVDALKSHHYFPKILEGSSTLNALVTSFYQQKYIRRLPIDSKSPRGLVYFLLATSVHMGTFRAIQILQKALNLLNRNGKEWADIEVDGITGRQTKGALEACLSKPSNADYLIGYCYGLTFKKYIEILTHSKSQEKYSRGWYNRLKSFFTKGKNENNKNSDINSLYH